MLGRNPAFSAIAVLTLAIAIGANTAIFTAANDFLLRPLPFANSSRVVMVKQYNRKLLQSGWVDAPTFKYWRERNSVFEDMAAWSQGTEEYNLTGAEGPERVTGKQVSSAFFRVLGVNPILGRTFSDAEDRAGGGHVAIISHSLWASRYGQSPTILGKTIILDGRGYTVIGVLPAGFRFSTTPEQVWTPLGEELDGGRGGYFLNVIGSLKGGVTLAQARADMATLQAQFAKEFPEWAQDQSVAVESLRDRYVRQVRPAIIALLAGAALVLFIACANVANLLLARAASRQKEITIRRALGGHRSRIVRQLLTESLLLALLGAAGGLAIAFTSVRLLYATVPTAWQPLTRGGVDGSVLAYALAVSLLTVLLFGIAPAWNVTCFDLNESLKETHRASLSGLSRQSFRAALVTGEIALAGLLFVGASLLIKSFVRLSAADLGILPDNVLTASISRTNGNSGAFYQDVLDRISRLPHVRASGAVNMLPLSGDEWGQDIMIEGKPHRPEGDLIWASHREVSVGYFRAIGIPLLKGRSFLETDRDKPVAIVSDTMARRYWPDEDPIGKRFGVNCAHSQCDWQAIVGVVADVKELGATAKPATAMYFLDWTNDMTLIVRANGRPENLISDVRGIIHSVDSNQPISELRTMDDIVSESIAPQRVTVLVAAIFAGVAVLLGAIGIFGVISYSVSERTREFGIRMALGADQDRILKLVLRQGFKLALIGAALGLFVALGLTRLVSTLLYGVAPDDPATFFFVFLALMTMAAIASYLPARRAMRLEPTVALRHE